MSFSVYPVNESGLSCKDYRVFVNGTEYRPDCARVSAAPINRRWPGHQRGVSQTELINFLSLETDEPLEIELLTKESFDPEKLKIRPLGSVGTPDTDKNTVRFSIPGPGYYSVEPFGRNHPFLIFADAVCDLSPESAPGDVIYFGPGVHRPGLIELKSNQTLFIDRGALVYASIYAKDAENISIVGRGIFDNSENREIILFEAPQAADRTAVANAKRSHAIQLDFCRNVRIEGITMRDSLCYNIKPVCCSDVSIRDLKLIGNWRYNSDGIDMHNCRGVVIENCFIRTYDDCICVKGFDPWMNEKDMRRGEGGFDVFDGLRVSGCTLWNDWGKCLEVGVEMRLKTIKNILYENCRAIHVTSTVLDCTNCDYADVRNVIFRNITVEFDEKIPAPLYQESEDTVYEDRKPDYAPLLCAVKIECHHEYSDKTHGRGTVSDVRFENIDVIGDQAIKLRVEGFDAEHRCANVAFSNIKRYGAPLTKDRLDLSLNEFTKNVSVN